VQVSSIICQPINNYNKVYSPARHLGLSVAELLVQSNRMPLGLPDLLFLGSTKHLLAGLVAKDKATPNLQIAVQIASLTLVCTWCARTSGFMKARMRNQLLNKLRERQSCANPRLTPNQNGLKFHIQTNNLHNRRAPARPE